MSDTGNRKFHIEKNYISDPKKYGDIFLLQVGRSHSTKGYMIGEHIHRNWFELTYIIEGKGQIITNGTPSPIKSGEIYLSFPGDIHAISTDIENPVKFEFLSFWPDDPDILRQFEKIMRFYSDPTRRIFSDNDVKNLMGNVLSEAVLSDEHSPQILLHALSQTVLYIVRNFSGDKKNAKLTVDSSRLTAVSEHLGYSYSYLSDVFHKATGDTLINYYTQRRLDAASMLIREGHLTMSEIAELLKYSSIYSFSRSFKKRFGICPTEFKKQKDPQ